jgi:hypothetical protein
VVLSSSLPNIGSGALKNREDPKVLGTSKVRSPATCLLSQALMSTIYRNQVSCSPHPRSTKRLLSIAHERKSPSICSYSVPPIKTLLALVRLGLSHEEGHTD